MVIQTIYQILNLLIGAMIFGVCIMTWLFFMRWRNAKEVEGKMLVHFFTAGGGYYYALCREDKGKVEAPPGHEVGDYFIQPECKYMGKWKPGQMRFAQVGVPTTAYLENEREPIVSVDPERWIKSPDKHKVTAFMQRVAINEAAMKTAQVLQMGVWKDIAAMAGFIKRVPLMFLMSLGTLVILLILLYFSYMQLQSVQAILQRGY